MLIRVPWPVLRFTWLAQLDQSRVRYLAVATTCHRSREPSSNQVVTSHAAVCPHRVNLQKQVRPTFRVVDALIWGALPTDSVTEGADTSESQKPTAMRI